MHSSLLKQIGECSLPVWYSTFEKISPQTCVLPIPQDVLKYLLDEIIILPKECYSQDPRVHEGFEDEDTEEIDQPHFPEFSQKIADAITELGGSVFVKTNWHSPKDALWITSGHTMRCQSIEDVYQLLKASSICKEDFTQYPIDDSGHHLVLRKWIEIHPGTEFRCFVRNGCVFAVSPRDWPEFHEHIGEQRTDIVSDVVSLFKEHLKHKFVLKNYVFDVMRKFKDDCMLIDFAPFVENLVEPLAFTWNELDELSSNADLADDPEFRYLATDCGIQPTQRNSYGVPKDILDFLVASGESSGHFDGAFLARLRDGLQINSEVDQGEGSGAST